MSNNASINLAISSFVANSNPAPSSGAPGGPYCPVSSLTLVDDASGQVTLSGSGSSTKVSVKRNANGTGNAPIRITFNISGPGGVNYNPKGIVFDQQQGNGDGNGNSNFPQANRNPNDQAITISDNMTNPAPGGTAFSWKFYIQIQKQDGSSNPPMGWIDPIIENDA